MDRPETPDRPNRGFMDFRDDPDGAEAVFEAQDVPGLQAMLRAVNAKGSSFMSLGCERNLNMLDPPKGDATCYLNSYLEVTYRDDERQGEQDMIDLAILLAQRSELDERNWAKLELGIEEMKHFFGEKGRYCLHIAISGYGRSKEEACKTHEHAGRRLAGVFDQLIKPAGHSSNGSSSDASKQVDDVQ
ncbi:MAG: hypothetical protein COA41_07165 [Sphingopyxis sp.]|nr:MAG: hypothetical protein COA41_07165 [Sphingopyxis sp.]